MDSCSVSVKSVWVHTFFCFMAKWSHISFVPLSASIMETDLPGARTESSRAELCWNSIMEKGARLKPSDN